MPHTTGVQLLAREIGVDVEHVAHALRFVAKTHTALRASRYSHLTDDQYKHVLSRDRFPIAIVANIAMRMAGRIEDAHLLMNIYKASTDAAPHRLHIRQGVGTLPDHHGHAHIQQVIRILDAADLPPIVTDGTRALRTGFQVLPACEGMPGWVLIAADPDCEHRTGFAGGWLGYAAVMRWAGWGVITEPLPGGLMAVCHPDHRNQPFPT